MIPAQASKYRQKSGATPELKVVAQSPSVPAATAKDRLDAALLSTLSDLAIRVRKDGGIAWVHVPGDYEFPVVAEHLVGRRLSDLLPSQVSPLVLHYIEKTLRTGSPQQFNCQHVLPGRVRVFSVKLAIIAPGEVLALVRDVTERDRLEKEIIESAHLTQSRIGQDLHDGLGQQLTGISFLSRALEKSLASKNLPQAGEAAEISRQVIEAIAQTRRLARGLFPVELETQGLGPALRSLAESVEELFRISCEFAECETATIEDPDVCLHLFRLTQEAAHNAVKHGKAQRVQIALQSDGDQWILTIRDDGVGFQAPGDASSGMGLRTMKYRAQKIGGILEIAAGDAGGTVVTCTFRSKPGKPPSTNLKTLI